MGEDSEPGRTGYYVNGAGVLMHKYSPKNMSSTQTWKVRHRVVVPGRHRQSVMQLAHDNISSGHVGAAKTLAKVKEQFIWPAMSRDIKRYCASCPICQRLGKGVKVFKAPLKPLPVISQPFQFVAQGAELQYRGEGAPRYHGGNPGIRCLHWPWTHHHLQRPPPARLAQPSQNLQPAYSALGASPLRIRPHSQTRERSGEQTS